MTTIPTPDELARFQPRWLIEQAAKHYKASRFKKTRAACRAEHRERFITYSAMVLPVVGLEEFLKQIRDILWDANCTPLDDEGESIIRKLAESLPKHSAVAEQVVPF